ACRGLLAGLARSPFVADQVNLHLGRLRGDPRALIPGADARGRVFAERGGLSLAAVSTPDRGDALDHPLRGSARLRLIATLGRPLMVQRYRHREPGGEEVLDPSRTLEAVGTVAIEPGGVLDARAFEDVVDVAPSAP